MAIRVQILPKKPFDDGSVRSVSGLSVCPPWWSTPNEHQFAQSTLPHDISLKVETPSRLYHRAKHNFHLQLPDREPTTVQSIGETRREVVLESATDSLCNALESGPDKSREKDIERQAKPAFLVNNANTLFGPSHQNYYHSMDCARYPYADAYFSGLFTPYEPQVIARLGGGATTRIPLPLDPAEDEPIYVNAKQYHGILRRRQCRAKLEAQNKLVKTRKNEDITVY